MQPVFISYSRKDVAFVRRLHEALAAQDRQTWVDWEGIAPSAEWMKEIRGAIDATSAFVFVLSPDSVASSVCREEIAHAVAQNKRLIPLVHREVDAALVPDALAKMNWIFFREQDDFDVALKTLTTAVDTDLDWVDAHTRLLVRARDWDARARENSLALRGQDLKAAEQWLLLGPSKEPQPTELQTLFVLTSRKVATQRRYMTLGAAAVALVAVAILGTTTYFGRREAARQQTIAAAGRLTGDAELLRDQAASSRNNAVAERGLLLATEAAHELGAIGVRSLQTDIAMRRSLAQLPPRVRHLTGMDLKYYEQIVLTDERLVVTQMRPFTVSHWLNDGTEVINQDTGLYADVGTISQDGKFLATSARDEAGRLDIWDSTTLERLATTQRTDGTINMLALSPSGTYLATGASFWNAAKGEWISKPTRIWHRVDGELRELEALPTAHRLAFSHDGKWLVGNVEDQLKVWAVPHESPGRFAAIPSPSESANFHFYQFSADGKLIVLIDEDAERLKLLTMGDWKAFREMEHDSTQAVSRDAKFVARVADNRTRIRIVATDDDREVFSFSLKSLDAVAFSPSGTDVAIVDNDNKVDVFDVARGGSDIARLDIGENVDDIVFDGDEKALLTIGPSATGSTMRRWEWSRSQDAPSQSFEIAGRHAVFSLDARYVAAADSGNLVVASALDGRSARALPLSGKPTAIALSVDGSHVAVATDDNTVSLWPPQQEARPQSFAVPSTIAPRELGVAPRGAALIAIASEGVSRTGERFLTHLWQAPQMHEVTSSSATGNNRSGFSSRPCAISADARLLASEALGTTVIKEAATDRIVAKLGVAADGPCMFSPDGTHLATSGTGVIRVWEVGTQTEIARIETKQTVSRLTFSRKNRYLASIGDGVAHIWLLEQADLIDLACSRATRNLSADEKRSYFGDAPYRATCDKLPVPDAAPQ